MDLSVEGDRDFGEVALDKLEEAGFRRDSVQVQEVVDALCRRYHSIPLNQSVPPTTTQFQPHQPANSNQAASQPTASQSASQPACITVLVVRDVACLDAFRDDGGGRRLHEGVIDQEVGQRWDAPH